MLLGGYKPANLVQAQHLAFLMAYSEQSSYGWSYIIYIYIYVCVCVPSNNCNLCERDMIGLMVSTTTMNLWCHQTQQSQILALNGAYGCENPRTEEATINKLNNIKSD